MTGSLTQRRAVFLDRDGVIVIPEFKGGRSFAPRRLADFRIYPEAPASLQRLKKAGFLLAVVTNQPDVGYGLVRRLEVDAMHEVMRRELPLDAVKACFHRHADGCNCRKPKPGMILEAAVELGVNLDKSFMVGDRSIAISRQAAQRAAPPSSSILGTRSARPMRQTMWYIPSSKQPTS
jgi:D-glycero-D-manno-heptose 1,7-bisphosphate phosphatase